MTNPPTPNPLGYNSKGNHESILKVCRPNARTLFAAALIVLLPLTSSIAQSGPAKVELKKEDGRYTLLVNHKPFFIRGAGLEFGNVQQLAAHGGNSFRTWRVDNAHESGRQTLDRAWQYGLYVTLGLDLARERHGFNYNDPAAVAAQKERIKAQVLRYKDHPAVLMWAIGNELNLNATNPKVWDAVNDISKMIHQIDPNHLTLTPLAGCSPRVVREVMARAPDLDLLGIQMYADIVNLPEHLRECGYHGAYVVTEWGATGHWEVGKTDWGAPLENDSSTKADFYLTRYQKSIAADPDHCLGSYAFLWGDKQERTPTWYGVFLKTGEETEAVDVLHYLWSDKWPTNRSPRFDGLWLDGRTAAQNVRLQPGRKYRVKLAAHDPDHDPLTYRWVVMNESAATSTGGDAEQIPKKWPGLVTPADQAEVELCAPAQPGAYRLFGYALDDHGHAAYGNIPFRVDAGDQTSQR